MGPAIFFYQHFDIREIVLCKNAQQTNTREEANNSLVGVARDFIWSIQLEKDFSSTIMNVWIHREAMIHISIHLIRTRHWFFDI